MTKLFIFCFILGVQWSVARTVDTVSIYSKAMHTSYRCVVVKPANYSNPKKQFETVYLLHGHSGSFSNWIKLVPEIIKFADQYQLIIVCPEGKYAGWYLDSPLTDSMQFETYVSKEVPAYIDSHFHTIKSRNARAITGLSMGGHGGLYLGFRHADFFGACGGMSGAFLIENITGKQYALDKILGDTIDKKNFYNHSIMQEMEHYPKDSLAIIFDCGTEDFIIEMSRAVHKKMLALNIPHDYTERPGRHEWAYWRTAIQFQLLYFRNFFDKKKGR